MKKLNKNFTSQIIALTALNKFAYALVGSVMDSCKSPKELSSELILSGAS
jgi:hypothetical protein